MIITQFITFCLLAMASIYWLVYKFHCLISLPTLRCTGLTRFTSRWLVRVHIIPWLLAYRNILSQTTISIFIFAWRRTILLATRSYCIRQITELLSVLFTQLPVVYLLCLWTMSPKCTSYVLSLHRRMSCNLLFSFFLIYVSYSQMCHPWCWLVVHRIQS